jgi:hypothetical protein
MHQEGFEGPRSYAEPKAFAFDGWSMVPIAPPPVETSTIEAAFAEVPVEPQPA